MKNKINGFGVNLEKFGDIQEKQLNYNSYTSSRN